MSEIYPISSGKGGVGKSFIAASLGALLAKHGKKVLLVDLDLGASNLHTLLGIKNPKSGLDSFLNKTVTKLEHVTSPTIIPNLFIISSLHCSMEIANLLHVQKQKIIGAIRELPFDYILLDLGAGTSFNTLDFFLTSKKGIYIFTPEPTSIENTFRFIRAVYLRRLKKIIKRYSFTSIVKDAVAGQNNEATKWRDIIDIVLKHDPDREKFLKDKLSELNFKFIINQFRNKFDAKLGDKIEIVCNRHFYSAFEFLGSVSYDERVYDSVISKDLFILKHPNTTSSSELKKIAYKIQ